MCLRIYKIIVSLSGNAMSIQRRGDILVDVRLKQRSIQCPSALVKDVALVPSWSPMGAAQSIAPLAVSSSEWKNLRTQIPGACQAALQATYSARRTT